MRNVAVASMTGRAMLAGIVLSAASCASAPPDTLTARLNEDVRRLTMHCYWHRDGERIVMGGLHIYQACRRWAQDQVRVRLPESSLARVD